MDDTFRKETPPGNATVILHPDPPKQLKQAGDSAEPFSRLQEAIGLAHAIRLDVVHAEVLKLREIRPSTIFGPGVVKRLAALMEEKGAKLVIIDGTVGPIQQRNLEKAWNCKVIDRTGLILEIFGERARTAEGRMQVELAALTYQRSRLVRSWTHLERQRGGLGFVGGPGETQLEVDRRLIDERITRLKKDLKTVVRTRTLHRKSRQKVPYPIVALVGYTNAGKSTLFNRLTDSNVMAKDILFATLDPTMRSLKLPSGRTVILSDTVGFISELPTTLIAAFRATLEEVLEADLLLHVRDISQAETRKQRKDVLGILDELGLDDPNMIEVLNKCDQIDPEDAKESLKGRKHVSISALTGENTDTLLKMIDENLSQHDREYHIRFALENGALLAWLYDHGDVINREDHEQETVLRVRISQANFKRLESQHAGHFKAKSIRLDK